MPRLVVLLALLAGCYGPKLSSPGFFCHASDNPACPNEQVCVDGRCVDKSEAARFNLAGQSLDGPAVQDGGGSTDLAHGLANLSKLDSGKDSGGGGPCALRINEVQTAGSASASDEFIELYNSCATSLPVSGYKLVYRSSNGTTNVDFLTFGSVSVGANGFYVAGQTAFTGTADVRYTSAMAAAGGGLAILDGSGAIVDSLGWGTASNSFVKGSPAPAPASAQTIGRLPDGKDSGNNANDFTVNAMPTPGAANQ